MKSQDIFKKGSTTYFYSSLFFPVDVRKDVTTLYAFVRTVDDFVDSITPDVVSFETYDALTREALKGNPSNNIIIDEFVELVSLKSFDHSWVLAFMDSMRKDLTVQKYKQFKDLEEYMYGSANVIGYMMAAIMGLPKKSHKYAGELGKAMQLINFIRDIEEDLTLGRVYLPQEDLKKFEITTIDASVADNPQWEKFVNYELGRYYEIQKNAEKGYSFIPLPLRIPIKTAADMYVWTAKQIAQNPSIVFSRKVKPSKYRIFGSYITNSLSK